MRVLTVVALAMLLAACGGDEATGPAVGEIAGRWWGIAHEGRDTAAAGLTLGRNGAAVTGHMTLLDTAWTLRNGQASGATFSAGVDLGFEVAALSGTVRGDRLDATVRASSGTLILELRRQ